MTCELTVRNELPKDWELLTRDAPVAADRWWIGLGRGRLGTDYRSFTLREDGTAAVSMAGAVLRTPPGSTRVDPLSVLSGATASIGLAADEPPPWRGESAESVFPCLLLMYPDYASFPVGPRAADGSVLRRFLDEVTRWATDAGLASVALLYLAPPAAGALLEQLPSAGFAVVPLIARCDLEVGWADFEGYLSTLPSKRRVEARRELRRIEERGLNLGTRPLAVDEPELLRLRCLQVAKYGAVADPEREHRYLDLLRGRPAGEVTVFTMQRADEMLGFSLFVQDRDVWTAAMTGADYRTADSSFAYFATLFYQPAALAPARGVRTIAYGPGSVSAKRRRGCKVTQLWAAGRICR